MTPRAEFGIARSSCACRDCQRNCRHMPGFLIPADLTRMIPPGADPFLWAEANLLASPGALVAKDGKLFRIPTLVPAVKADGSCIHLTGGKRNGKCAIHEIAPFGCAFFDCKTPNDGREQPALVQIHQAAPGGSLSATVGALTWVGEEATRTRNCAPQDHGRCSGGEAMKVIFQNEHGFITDFGEPQTLLDQAGGAVMEIPRYGVWKMDPRKAKHQVTVTTNDLSEAKAALGVPVVKRRKEE